LFIFIISVAASRPSSVLSGAQKVNHSPAFTDVGQTMLAGRHIAVSQENAQNLAPNIICPPSLDEKFLASLYKGLTEAVFVIEFNSRCVVHWNEGAEALFKHPADEMLQQTAERLFTDPLSFDRLDGVAFPEIGQNGFWRGEVEWRRRDGSRFIGETTGTLLKTDGGSYVTVVVRDITDRKEIENLVHQLNQRLAQRAPQRGSELMFTARELEKTASEGRQTEQLLEILLRNLTNYAILVLSPEGYILHWNTGTERVLGYTSDEVEQMHLSNFYRADPNEREKWQGLLESAKVQNGFRDNDWLLRKDGSRFYARVEVFVLRDEATTLNGYLILLRDDTEQRKIRERLKDKEHMAAVGTATAMLAHEIKNPLNGMSTTVQLLERSLSHDAQPTKETMIATIRDLKSEIARLQSLLGDFQAISHPQRLTFQSVDLPRLMHELTSLVMPECLKQKIKIVEQYASDLPVINGDADRLKQAFLNLIKNASEAMPRGGTLTTKAYATDDEVCVEITDTGEGIPPDINVFELFSSTKAEGTGLGLVIVRQIIMAHNGSIEYSSEPGSQTTFRVTLPTQNHSSS
jgi:PAS domain S-box-containing protein